MAFMIGDEGKDGSERKRENVSRLIFEIATIAGNESGSRLFSGSETSRSRYARTSGVKSCRREGSPSAFFIRVVTQRLAVPVARLV